jgi:hypothetical protein
MHRQWQATIEVADQPLRYLGSEEKCIYGETVDTLLTAVRTSLLESKPQYFSNRGDHVTGRFQYYYSDGELTRGVLIEEMECQPEDLNILPKKTRLAKGWWCRELVATPDSVSVEQFVEYSLRWMESFEQAVHHFIKWAIIPEKGPDYQARGSNGCKLRPHLLKGVLREKEENVVNDLIQRGWYVIALEYQGTLSIKEELVNRHTVFVLGHEDLEAAQKTFDAKYYHRFLKLCG